MYHYAGNNPVKYTDPDGRISGYLNDSEAVGGAGHSAMFVETYDSNGKSTGFELYEVGTVRQDGDKWVGVGPDGNNIPGTIALSHNKLDGKMGIAAGSVAGSLLGSAGSGVLSAAGSGSATSAAGGATIESLDSAAGVFVRKYGSYEEMMNASENKRYDFAISFNTNQGQDQKIRAEALSTGYNFGKYNLFTNNCSQHASRALAAGGVHTTSNPVPNLARDYILNNGGNSYVRRSWR